MSQSRFQLRLISIRFVMFRSNSSEILPESITLDRNLWKLFFPLPAAYAGIHLTAWGYSFPSLAESLCWKATCLIIIACCSLILLIQILAHFPKLFKVKILSGFLIGIDLILHSGFFLSFFPLQNSWSPSFLSAKYQSGSTPQFHGFKISPTFKGSPTNKLSLQSVGIIYGVVKNSCIVRVRSFLY